MDYRHDSHLAGQARGVTPHRMTMEALMVINKTNKSAAGEIVSLMRKVSPCSSIDRHFLEPRTT